MKVGISSDTHYELLSGLDEGEEIVTGSYKAISKDLSCLLNESSVTCNTNQVMNQISSYPDTSTNEHNMNQETST